MRNFLRDTGTPQATDRRHIGPLPNLRRALAPAPNLAPKALFTYKRLVGTNNLVALDGTGSSDSDGHITSWRWTVDGVVVATGVNPNARLGSGTSKP